jgi:hypothetical protein
MKVLRIVLDNGTPEGRVEEFNLEKVRSVQIIESLWNRIRDHQFTEDDQTTLDDFVQPAREGVWIGHTFVGSPTGNNGTHRGHHCGNCGAEGRQRLSGSEYCLECIPEKPEKVGNAQTYDDYMERYPTKGKKSKKSKKSKKKKKKKEHRTLTAEERDGFVQIRREQVGKKIQLDGHTWDVVDHIKGSQYLISRNETIGATKFRLGTRRKVQKYASHSKSGWKFWEVR